MSRYLITTLLAIVLFVPVQDPFTLSESIQDYNPQKNETTVRLPSAQLSGPKDRYHSLSYSIYYSYPGRVPAPPEQVNFELVSIVKARKLNTDLYVLFIVDGKEIHFGSNRRAIPKPVPGRLWIGERMVFMVPRGEFMKIAAAEKLGVKLGGVSFEFSEENRDAIRAFAKTIKE